MNIPVLSPIPFRPNADIGTKHTVQRLVGICDGRAACTKEELEGIICGILALRGLAQFKILKQNMSVGQKAAIDQVLRHLHSELIVGVKGKDTYKVTTDSRKLGPTKVINDTPSTLKFRVQNEFTAWSDTKAIPCADLVGTISNNHACVLTLPDVALTLQYLSEGREFPVKINKLNSLDDITLGRSLAKDYRDIVAHEMARAGYLGVFIDDGDTDKFTFAVTIAHAVNFPTWLEAVSKEFFKQWKLDRVKFSAKVQSNRHCVAKTITGQPTTQLLRTSAGITRTPAELATYGPA